MSSSPPPPPPSLDDLFDDPALLASSDARAMDDLLGGRIVGHDAVLAWLAGWNGGDGADAARLADEPSERGARPIVWTETAIGDCETIRRYLGMVSQLAARRLADALAIATHRLARTGDGQTPGVADHLLLRPFLIRIQVERDRLAVLGIRQSGNSRIL